MKRFLSILGCFAVLCFLTACNQSKKTSEVNEQGLPIYEFNNEDSVTVRTLADTYVQHFKAKDFEACADMLYTVHNDSIFPLSKEMRDGFIKAMKVLPILDLAVKSQTLRSDKDNEVRIALLMSPDGDLETEKGTINYKLNPVFIDEEWHLTIRDKYAEGVGLYSKE